MGKYIDECRLGVHGGFKRNLVLLWDVADSGHREKLLEAFPEVFTAKVAAPTQRVVQFTREAPVWLCEEWSIKVPLDVPEEQVPEWIKANMHLAYLDNEEEGSAVSGLDPKWSFTSPKLWELVP